MPGQDEAEEKAPMSHDEPGQHNPAHDDQPAQQALDQHMQMAFDDQPSTEDAVGSSEQVMMPAGRRHRASVQHSSGLAATSTFEVKTQEQEGYVRCQQMAPR